MHIVARGPQIAVAAALHQLGLAATAERVTDQSREMHPVDSAEKPLCSKNDSEKDHLGCIPRPFKSRTAQISAEAFPTLFMDT
jgi:hypothetical protein